MSHFFINQFLLLENISMALFLAYVVKLTALTRDFVSVVPEFHIHEASRTFWTLRNLTIDLHLFTYISRTSS